MKKKEEQDLIHQTIEIFLKENNFNGLQSSINVYMIEITYAEFNWDFISWTWSAVETDFENIAFLARLKIE